MVDARKEPVSAADVPALLAGARRVIACRGKKSVPFDVAKDGITPELAREVVGRSGTLRAPALRLGRDWLVGFGEPGWSGYFG